MDPELKHLVKKQKEQIKYLLFLCTVMGLLVLVLSFYWLSGERTPKLTIAQVQDLCRFLECTIFDIPADFSRGNVDD